MKQSSWGCTIFIQLSLCLIVYVSLHLGHPFFSSNDVDNATPLDLYFISVAGGGFRPLHRQTHLLRLMEKAAETYKAKFVVSSSEHGEDDPLLQHASRVSSSLKIPWYTRKKGSGYSRERIAMPFNGSLDVVFVDIGSLQQDLLGGTLNGSTISQLKRLTRILKAADGDWRIVVGSDSLLTLRKEPKEFARTFYQIMTKYGVNLYISEKGCTSESLTCITVPNQSENRGLTSDSNKREMEDGFLLHRVSFSEFVTYTINSSGQVIDTRLVKQKGKETI
ncbi:PREDICTED: uncharacterized protein LOC104721736 [Camelina sativa]|uniref:Uncharacterized protein LOC104721736 n=1 Tax=Camelina sativa TaxID=90675 RepID=A0ABM0U9Y6_CAMSA|nr:PREDICTED: uncharacterized protein LOC104721736 [Camelina sativa]